MLETSGNNTEGHDAAELRLWRAVLASVLQEWIHGPLRKRREAEHFLFHDSEDYRTVCFSAGIDPAHLRYRLLKIRAGTSLEAIAVASQN
jgi:hypothetical protein